ncbi:hypothetical protein IGK30_002922 [Enterococcus sp. AZ178]|uniref:hypothetical protein n=1 Tax=Enterococcus sp. AZ178 TaxID=2774822 RepID=UPI003F26E75B
MSDKSKKASEKVSHSKKCFFITPIGDSKSNEFEKLEGLIDNVLNPVLKEKDYDIIVAHKIQSLGSINDQIFKSIINSDLIISNLTGLNANVMYETAVAHSFGKPTIMISEIGTVLPFDLKTDRTIFFSDSIKGTGMLKTEISKKITQLETDSTTDNPIVRVIQTSKLTEQLNKENLSEDETIMKMILDLSKKVDKLDKNTYDEKYTIFPALRKVRIIVVIDENRFIDKEIIIEELLNYNGILEAGSVRTRIIDGSSRLRVKVDILTYIDNNAMIKEIIETCFGEVSSLKISTLTSD